MTILDAVISSGLERIDAELLLSHLLQKSRAWIVAHSDYSLDNTDERLFQQLAHRRRDGEPMAYILRKREFYGREFAVDPGILIPRPCTEALVERALTLLDGECPLEEMEEIDAGIVAVHRMFQSSSNVCLAVDIGTGTGCIAVSLACERSSLQCIATDSDSACLECARRNAEMHGVGHRIEYRQGSFLDPVQDVREPFLLVTNPPYIAHPHVVDEDVRNYEPLQALYGGDEDGGDILRRIVAEASSHLFCVGIVVECLRSQAPIVLSPS